MTERYEVPPGDEMQIDFGFDEVLISGVKTRICIFVAVLSYSRRVFAKVYPRENQTAWLDGIESAFKHFNGVPVAVVSDNTRCLVDSRAEKGENHFQSTLSAISSILAICSCQLQALSSQDQRQGRADGRLR